MVARRGRLRRALRFLLRGVLGLVTRVYFRKLVTVAEPAPDTAGRLFAANHFNGIIDPLLILARARYDASPVAKSTLFKLPVLRSILAIAEAVPVTRRKDQPDKAAGDNDKVFDHVARHLHDGGNILIFPEGVSHDEAHVLPLKSGAARMLSLARARGARGLTLQAVALDFDARERFRSRAMVTYGPVHQVDSIAAEVGEGDPLVHALMARITSDLDRLVVQGESQGELFLIRRIAELLANEAQSGDYASQVEIARGVVSTARALGPEDPRYRAVVHAVGEYSRSLSAAKITDRQVAHGRSLTLRRIVRGVWLSLLSPLAVLGAVLWFVPYRLPRLATGLAKGETDVVSTYKLGIGVLVFPLWFAGLVGATAWWPGSLRLLALLAIPLSAYAALVWVDRLDDRRGARLLREVSTSGRKELLTLAELRRGAIAAVEAARSAGPPADRGSEDSHG